MLNKMDRWGHWGQMNGLSWKGPLGVTWSNPWGQGSLLALTLYSSICSRCFFQTSSLTKWSLCLLLWYLSTQHQTCAAMALRGLGNCQLWGEPRNRDESMDTDRRENESASPSPIILPAFELTKTFFVKRFQQDRLFCWSYCVSVKHKCLTQPSAGGTFLHQPEQRAEPPTFTSKGYCRRGQLGQGKAQWE